MRDRISTALTPFDVFRRTVPNNKPMQAGFADVLSTEAMLRKGVAEMDVKQLPHPRDG